MRCPFCGTNDDKVLDSRESPEGETIKRRRECKNCGRRFTTFEQIEEMAVYVMKKDGRREPFKREKILKGLQLSCTGRPVSQEQLEGIADEIERKVYNRLEREIGALEVGEMVMEALKGLDQVAYVRFASVYRQFEDATQFRDIVTQLRKRGAKS
jgi:transcriptional repressor NrdR